MSLSKSTITPCLWFDSEGEEAANFYTSIFPDSEIGRISHYTEVSFKPFDSLRIASSSPPLLPDHGQNQRLSKPRLT